MPENSDDRYRLAFEFANAGMLIVGLNGLIEEANARTCEILGLEAGSLNGTNVNDRALPEDGQISIEAIERLLTGKSEHETFEKRYRHRDGRIVHGLVSVALVRDHAGAPTYFISQLQDISSRKRLEENLLASERRFREIVESANVVIYTMDPDGCFQYVSPGWNEILGGDPDFLIGRNYEQVIHPDDLSACRAFLKLVFSSRSKQSGFEYRVRHADGNWRWHSSNVSPMLDKEGNLIGMLGIAHDISNRIALEESLRISEERYRLLAESARDVIWTMELDGSISYVSPSVENVRGFTPAEAIRQPLHEILTSGSIRVVLGYFDRLQSDVKAGRPPEPFRGDLEYYCKDGSTFWTEVIAAPLLNSDSSVFQIVGVTRDISERKKAEADLQVREERLNFALAASGLGCWDWDVLEDQMFFDDRSLSMLGYAPDELSKEATTWEQLAHPDEKSEIHQAITAHIAGDTENYEMEHRFRHKAGHWVWIQVRGKVISRGADGKPLRMTGTHQDTSIRRRIERESSTLLGQIEKLMREAVSPQLPDTPPMTKPKGRAVDSLTRRQREVLSLVASGCTSSEIGQKLHIATETVEAHRRDLMRKLNLHSVAGLTRFAMQEGLTN